MVAALCEGAVCDSDGTEIMSGEVLKRVGYDHPRHSARDEFQCLRSLSTCRKDA